MMMMPSRATPVTTTPSVRSVDIEESVALLFSLVVALLILTVATNSDPSLS